MAETGFRSRAGICVLLLACVLSACSSGSPRLAYRAPDAPTRLAIPPAGKISAGPRDTVYTISKRYGVPVRDIILANGLQPPYRLSVGQDIRLPAPNSYVVRPGDTIFAISQRFSVDMRTVVQMNGIAPPYQIEVGQELRLPSRELPVATTRQPSSVGLPVGPGSRSKATRTALLTPGVVATPELNPARGSSNTPVIATPTPRPAPVASGKTGLEVAKIRPPARSSAKFRWPVRGRVIANFGPRKGGLHNDGINIAAPRGAPIAAADNGVVAYAGDELPGFGKLLLVKHSGGWITAYAHSDRLLVKRGDVVRRGQTIATVGSSGSVDRPQLHFEVRRDKRAVDPRKYLDRS